jgi:hypothetical protein
MVFSGDAVTPQHLSDAIDNWSPASGGSEKKGGQTHGARYVGLRIDKWLSDVDQLEVTAACPIR